MNNEEKLIEFLKNNHGYISTSELLELKIYKPQIQFYINKGIIERVCHGLYMDTGLLKDEYYIGIGDSGLCIFDKHTFKLIQMYKIPKKHCLMGQILVLPNQNLVVSLSEGITKIYG